MSLLLATGLGLSFGWIALLFQEEMEGVKLKEAWLGVKPSQIPLEVFQRLRPAVLVVSGWFEQFLPKFWSSFWVRRMEKAGFEGFSPLHWIAFKAVLASIFVIAGFLSGWKLALGLGLMGSFFPNLWLRSFISKREAQIRIDLPTAIDLLSLSVEAGLDFFVALKRVVDFLNEGHLRKELNRLLTEIQLGKSRSEALQNFRTRLKLVEIDHFVSLLCQAARLGAPIGPVLAAQAEKIRQDRFARAEAKGALAAQKVLFPLVFCIIPAVFLVLMAPLLLQWASGGMEGIF